MAGLTVVQNGYTVTPIDRDTWRITDIFQDYMYLVQGGERAALIDTGMGQPGLSEVVKALTDRPVIVLNTHGHLDHVGCNQEFDTVCLHPSDREVAEQHRSPAYREKIRSLARDTGVELSKEELDRMICLEGQCETQQLLDGQVIDLGGRKLEVIHTPGHTRGSVCFLDADARQLFSGDTVCHMGVMLSFPESVSVSGFIDTIRKLKAREGQIDDIYPGHHKVPLDCGYFDQYLECAARLLEDPEGGIAEHSVFDDFFRYFYKDVSLTYKTAE